jgi:hypothetical protein
MVDATITEFPFVASLPKREKSKLAKAWDTFRALSKIAETEGLPIPQLYAAKVLGISRQRVYALVEEGRLKVVIVNGERFVTENSVIEYAKSERKAGRPPKIPETLGEAYRAAKELRAGR